MSEFVDVLRLSRQGRYQGDGLQFTAIGATTTGLRPGHLVELAAVRVSTDGTVHGEASTLIDPGRDVDPDPGRVHGIRRGQLDTAPAFPEVLGRFVELWAGSVLVAHNLAFVERFLVRELDRSGVRLPPAPGVCTATAAKRALRLPNYRLATVAEAIGAPDAGGRGALANARSSARVVCSLVTTHRLRFIRKPRFTDAPRLRAGRLAPRPGDGRTGQPYYWMARLVDRASAGLLAEGDRPLEDAYLDLLAGVVADHTVSRNEVRALATMAVRAGIPGAEVLRVHRGFMTAIHVVASGEGGIAPEEQQDLRNVAEALGVPEAVRDLAPGVPRQRASPPPVFVLGDTAEVDELRAAVLGSGLRLAGEFGPGITHLVVDDAAADEPGVRLARELGAVVLPARVAREVLELAPGKAGPLHDSAVDIPAPRVSEPPARYPVEMVVGRPVRERAGRALKVLGGTLLVAALVCLFCGLPLAIWMLMTVLGAAASGCGWYLAGHSVDVVRI
ncbi:3'-5' exonuclease [Qaidamihabitans albus]|uniref:3'-5' exonuclease n=1 Tax=Qaidamihabitans albus TaxID=2795733 RepID=UPI0018F204CB|nr:3'-5' exonuclease [Qaidamihabitans albus]